LYGPRRSVATVGRRRPRAGNAVLIGLSGIFGRYSEEELRRKEKREVLGSFSPLLLFSLLLFSRISHAAHLQ
jgi:hypothetical protein